jgi:hypothetical protein
MMLVAMVGIISCCQQTSVVPASVAISATSDASCPRVKVFLVVSPSFADSTETVCVGRLLLLPILPSAVLSLTDADA